MPAGKKPGKKKKVGGRKKKKLVLSTMAADFPLTNEEKTTIKSTYDIFATTSGQRSAVPCHSIGRTGGPLHLFTMKTIGKPSQAQYSYFLYLFWQALPPFIDLSDSITPLP